MNKKIRRRAIKIILKNDEKEELEKRIKGHTISARGNLRAQIILLKSQEMTQEEIQEKLSISLRTVIKWVNRFIEKGLES